MGYKRREGHGIPMVAITAPMSLGRWMIDDDRRVPMERCLAILAREGFTVSWILDGPVRRLRPPDLMASHGPRTVRVFVLLDDEVDRPETRERIRASAKDGETRVCVPWPLRWRALSNLERWGIGGVAVLGW